MASRSSTDYSLTLQSGTRAMHATALHSAPHTTAWRCNVLQPKSRLGIPRTPQAASSHWVQKLGADWPTTPSTFSPSAPPQDEALESRARRRTAASRRHPTTHCSLRHTRPTAHAASPPAGPDRPGAHGASGCGCPKRPLRHPLAALTPSSLPPRAAIPCLFLFFLD